MLRFTRGLGVLDWLEVAWQRLLTEMCQCGHTAPQMVDSARGVAWALAQPQSREAVLVTV